MSLPTVIGAYNDCLDYFIEALATPRGIRICLDTYSNAKFFALRMNQARALLREESQRIYPKDNPLYGRSEYDGFQVKTPVEDTEGHWWVYIEPHNARVLAVETIEEPAKPLTYTKPLALEDKRDERA